MNAVVFGTLTDPSAEAGRRSAFAATAAALGVPREAFWEAMSGSELYESWPTTPFAPFIDAAVFSWREGYRKPDQRLYATVASRLGVPPAACWYVGDGGSREHWGAATAGMRPILVTNANYPSAASYRDDPDSHVPDVVVDEVASIIAVVCQDLSCP